MICFFLSFVEINELVDCRDISIGAWFEGVIEKVSPSTKGQNGKAETAPPAPRVGRPRKQTNGKLDCVETLSSTDSNGTSEKQINSDNSEPSTSKTVSTNSSEDVAYHIKYEE